MSVLVAVTFRHIVGRICSERMRYVVTSEMHFILQYSDTCRLNLVTCLSWWQWSCRQSSFICTWHLCYSCRSYSVDCRV